MCFSSRLRQAGFTLVEMALALTIIALLLGAVMGGQHILHTSRLTKIVTDYQKYRSAILQFSDKYQELPGDMKDAVSFWGSVSATAPCTAPTSAAGGNAITSSGSKTCNRRPGIHRRTHRAQTAQFA